MSLDQSKMWELSVTSKYLCHCDTNASETNPHAHIQYNRKAHVNWNLEFVEVTSEKSFEQTVQHSIAQHLNVDKFVCFNTLWKM